jgi:hypothetical protein
MWKTQELGDHMNLTEADRQRIGIRTIGAIDMTPAERKQQRKLRDKERKCAGRRAKGAKPHEESKSRTKPWLADGISRRTWYRRQAENRGTDSSTVNLVNTADKTVPPSKRKRRRNRDRINIMPDRSEFQPASATAVRSHMQELEIPESCDAGPVSPKIWRWQPRRLYAASELGMAA